MSGCCSHKKIESPVLGYGKNRHKKEIKKKKREQNENEVGQQGQSRIKTQSCTIVFEKRYLLCFYIQRRNFTIYITQTWQRYLLERTQNHYSLHSLGKL